MLGQSTPQNAVSLDKDSEAGQQSELIIHLMACPPAGADEPMVRLERGGHDARGRAADLPQLPQERPAAALLAMSATLLRAAAMCGTARAAERQGDAGRAAGGREADA